ncbi:MAG: hypothetical protein U0Y82_13190 [Thermoleophilia bacterium]
MMQLGTAVVAGVPEVAVIVPPAPGGDGRVDPAGSRNSSSRLSWENSRDPPPQRPAGIAAAAFAFLRWRRCA